MAFYFIKLLPFAKFGCSPRHFEATPPFHEQHADHFRNCLTLMCPPVSGSVSFLMIMLSSIWPHPQRDMLASPLIQTGSK